MGLIELILIAIGVSMDAFAVSVCKGLTMRKVNYKVAFILAFFFGLFQGGMPALGYLLGTQLMGFISPIDHWTAFGLLVYIGGKMIFDELHSAPAEDVAVSASDEATLDMKEVLLLAVATSIDALAVGISFAALKVNIVSSALLIGFTTFFISFLGVIVGNVFGSRYERKAAFIGGGVLILIGCKILLEHLGFLAF